MALVVTGVAIGAVAIPLPLYVERPAAPVTLRGCVEAEEQPEPLSGDYLVMTISLYQATPVDAVSGWLEEDASVIDRSTIIPPGVDDDTFFDDQAALFASTADIATVVAMRAAGLDARLAGEGAAIISVVAGGPADGILQHGDVVTAVAGEPVAGAEALLAAVQKAPAGQPLQLDVDRDNTAQTVTVTPVSQDGRSLIGVQPQTLNPVARLPFDVDVQTGDIGGPSAGLTLALAVYDAVSQDDLAAGRRLAVTGTMDLAGNVGPVGGIGLKTIAADRAGAELFVIPSGHVTEAEGALPKGSAMRIVGVDTFNEARDVLAGAASATNAVPVANDAQTAIAKACA